MELKQGQTLSRKQWQEVCETWKAPENLPTDTILSGSDFELDSVKVEMRDNGVTVEMGDGRSITDIMGFEGATDIRIGKLQLLASREHAALIWSLGPYPIQTWIVLWAGSLPE